MGQPFSWRPYIIAANNNEKHFYSFFILAVGLFTAQIIATVQVYISNNKIYSAIAAVQEAGYLAVPNRKVLPALIDLSSAFWGGLFFTLSIGAGISLLAYTAVRLLYCFPRRYRSISIFFVILWGASILAVNHRSFCPVVSAYFILIPVSIYIAFLNSPLRSATPPFLIKRIKQLLPVIFLMLLWAAQMDKNIFIDFRDTTLLTNSFGIKMNDIYYKYTLFPAEAIKTYNQKLIKTCQLRNVTDKTVEKALVKQLLAYDYLPVDKGPGGVDLIIQQEQGSFFLINKNETILKVTTSDFFLEPKAILNKYSAKSDRYMFFRQAIYFSLLLGSPLVLYVFFYALVYYIGLLLFSPEKSAIAASLFCFLVGIAILSPFHNNRINPVAVDKIGEALESNQWHDRVAGLKTILGNKMEVNDYQVYERLLTSPHIPERYWLAKTLGVSRTAQTYKDLLYFLDDPQPNVVSMALEAVGRRGNIKSAEEIIKRIQISDNWYSQLYAYRALRNLGWKQMELK